ncbi:succinate--CoA ligase subunit alpha [Candidatus Bathyarchaeota archaeon]|nr:succinate--CoA ligase subunit alpha [Candidatus Bathyarchaeota archaeon]
MCILIDEYTKVIIQGITGTVGSFQTKVMLNYGTKVVAGVTPGKGGQTVHGVPVYDLVEDAVEEKGGDASLIFVPGPYAADAAIEAVEAGVSLAVMTAEGVPLLDVMKVMNLAAEKSVAVIGPDTAGLISPGRCKVGVHPHRLFMEGSVGVVSKSGALSYETSKALTEAGYGQSTVIGIGGGPMWGLTQVEALRLFEEDEGTKAVVLLGEIGGSMEEEAAEFIGEHMSKPVVSLIVGRHAPEGERMGHAGAIIQGGRGTAAGKIAALENAGARVVKGPRDIPLVLKELL